MPKIVVVTPTYNEKENIGLLADKLFSMGIKDLELVVVDDASPDGTAGAAEELAKKYPIRVIKRAKKSGLGTAYADAFREILNSETEFPSGNPVSCIIQMDADLSHDPAAIPLFLEKINPSTGSGQERCDLVLGSRYVAGGHIANWDATRRMVSRFGNIYAKAVLGLPYQDLTGGFKCWRRDALENLFKPGSGAELHYPVSSTGYNFQIETTHKAHAAGYKICEIPITFTERKSGVSKFNLSIMLEAFWRVLKLRLFS